MCIKSHMNTNKIAEDLWANRRISIKKEMKTASFILCLLRYITLSLIFFIFSPSPKQKLVKLLCTIESFLRDNLVYKLEK